MVSRFFTNPRWSTKARIEWRSGSTVLYRHFKDGTIEEWSTAAGVKYNSSKQALARCLRAVERDAWREIDIEKELAELVTADVPETEVVAW